MTSPTWINLVCPACGCLPLEEPIGDAVRHVMYCQGSPKVEDANAAPDIFADISEALKEAHGFAAYCAAVSANLVRGEQAA